MNTLRKLSNEKILVFDGAMGTQLQKLKSQDSTLKEDKYLECGEYLNLVRPNFLQQVHEKYLDAGVDIIETNTLNATSVALSDYGLENKTKEINFAAVKSAKTAIKKYSHIKPRFVAGSMGPTAKSIFISQNATYGEMKKTYYEQATYLIEAGADILLFETMQDILNLKAGLEAAFSAKENLKSDIEIMSSASFGLDGKMLSGQNIESYFISLAHFDLLGIGLNCSAGPTQMEPNVKKLSEISTLKVSAMPNAGLPDESGKYLESPKEFAKKTAEFAKKGYVNFIGGCCGTSPEHIRELIKLIEKAPVRKPQTAKEWAVCGTEAVYFKDIATPPMLVGERTNAVGSKLFREKISNGKLDEAVEVGKRQAKNGAHIIDVCLANPERDEKEDAKNFLTKLVRAVRLPIMIDSANIEVAKETLKLCPGKSILNSINMENGEKSLLLGAKLNKTYGTVLIVGCIDDDKTEGMAVTRQRKLEIAKRAYNILTNAGVPPEDIIFDALVFPASSIEGKYKGSATETMEAVRLIKKELPKCKVLLGASNVSYGMPPAGREVLNSVFIHHCALAGMDLAIVNVEKLKCFADIAADEVKLAEDMLFKPSEETINEFAKKYRDVKVKKIQSLKTLTPEETVYNCVLEGSKNSLSSALETLLKENNPMEIINGPLSKAMEEVGVRFSKGDLIITEVLQSAQAMKFATDILEPYLAKEKQSKKGKILLATVEGDVHDIGKNLVHIIFKSNGFDVIDLGVKVPTTTIVENALKENPDFIGLSALLTRSAETMIGVAKSLSENRIATPLLLGGAVLSDKFISAKVTPIYKGKTLYAKDAMDGLRKAATILR
jgi:5-methyltetrahydrofolate--homocysteine methyltransferase